MTNYESWLFWNDFHSEQNQLKRLNSAKEIHCTPLYIDKDSASGTFQGKIQKYNTSLIFCECEDFSKNAKPCKHMYRLALELGLIEGTFESSLEKITNQLKYEEAVIIIDSLPENAQITLRDFLYNHLYQDKEYFGFINNEDLQQLLNKKVFIECNKQLGLFDPFGRNELNKRLTSLKITGFKKNLSKEDLVSWIIDTVPDSIPAITSETIVVTLHPQLTKTKRKIYSHVKKKFQEDISWLWT